MVISRSRGGRLSLPQSKLTSPCRVSINFSKRPTWGATKKPFSTTRDPEAFFRFTRGRFVQNEEHEMASRYIRFDVHELAKIAANAVDSTSCARIEKLTDGMHNKAVQFTMDDGTEVIGKIPNPNAGPPHFTTASEVATMDYMRNVLGIPVPTVHTWCSHAGKTSVGAEYIIMDKAAGVSLKSMWAKLTLSERFAITKEIARYQALWSSASYEGYGSIYYASDLPEEHRMPLRDSKGDSKWVTSTRGNFALGPTTGREWIDDGRQSVEFDKGPWSTLEKYLQAVGRRELTCVNSIPRLPPVQVTLCGPGTYLPTREKKKRALEFYLQLFRHTLPSDPSVGKPSAWHSDLHAENIFVDPSEPTKITCIIDWQSTEVAPLFAQVRQPYILDHPGPQAQGLERPHLPDHFADLSQQERNMANRLLLDQSLCVGYRLWTRNQYSDIWDTFEFQETSAFQLLVLARSLLVDGEAIYSARVLELLESQDSLLKNTGLSIPQHVKSEIETDAEGALRGMEAMAAVQDALGDLFPENGCVRPEQYDETKNALGQCKEQIIAQFASTEDERAIWEELWPFDN